VLGNECVVGDKAVLGAQCELPDESEVGMGVVVGNDE
jgi:carbonic anhydrase/acetyltransferase-like protein (isoleucine patch superfamily)